jgi:hypothetical protein
VAAAERGFWANIHTAGPWSRLGLQLVADLALMPSDRFSFQARSIVRISARRLFSATERKQRDNLFFCQTAP